MKGRAAARPEPVRYLFEPPITWVPPKEFTDYLDQRAQALASAPVELPPTPAWAIEAATAPPTVLERRRDFAAPVERILRGEHLVIRERGADGHHTYRAFERATAFLYGITLDELTWGRIDTRRPIRSLDPYTNYVEAVAWQMTCSAEAQEVIRELCPEARRAAGETPPQGGVYDGPGYVLVTVDPEFRYRAARAREVPA